MRKKQTDKYYTWNGDTYIGAASLWIDYVPSESNPADVPSRLHEMTAEEARSAVESLGDKVKMIMPEFADSNGSWLSSTDIAASVWGR